MAQPMGIGNVGLPGTIVKRKFRFTMKIHWPGGDVPEHYVKVAGRPKLSIDSTEINFLNATTWLPGKAKWEPISVTYIDTTDTAMNPLYNWIASVYDFTQSTALPMSEKSGWSGDVTITSYDGCGKEVEQWVLHSCYPESVDFGELAYAESDESTIELQLRYSEVDQKGLCGPTASGTCKGC